MDVSIIIVNYNTKALIKKSLQSVFEKTKEICFEVIVVDNASHDGSQQMLKEEFPDVILVESCENLGFGKANNLGAKYACGKYLFLLNPDTILLNNAVKILSDFLNNNLNIGICGGNLYYKDEQPALSYSMFFPSIMWELNILFSCKIERLIYGKNAQFNHTNNAREVAYITGADLMIRTDLFCQLNGFDKNFFMYFEETELTYRVKNAGYKVYNVPQAQIIHLEGQTLSNNWRRKTKIFLDGREKYYKKTQKKNAINICNGIFKFSSVSKWIIFKVLNKEKNSTYWKFVSENIRSQHP